MVSTATSEIDTVRNFLRSPESIDIADLENTLGIINVSIEGSRFILALKPFYSFISNIPQKLGPKGEQIKQTILNSIPLSEFFTLLESHSIAVTSAACK